MSVFEAELKKGKFVIPECFTCKDIVWPPSDYCSICFGKVNWRKSDGVGKILEYSKKGEIFFCLAEFEKKIRIMGTLQVYSNLPEIGKKVRLDTCKVDGRNYNFAMTLV